LSKLIGSVGMIRLLQSICNRWQE